MLRKYPAVSQLTHALFFWSDFWPGHVAFGILVSQPKIDAVSPAAEAESYPLDHKGKILFPFNCSIVDLQCCVHPSSFNIAYRQSMKWETMFTNHLYNKGSRESPSGLMVRTQSFHYQGQGSIRGGQIEILQASENES